MKYADLSREHRALLKLDSWDSSNKYWVAVEAFKVQLRIALRDDVLMQKLTKQQLIQVIAWSSSYRPFEPHVILSTISSYGPSPS